MIYKNYVLGELAREINIFNGKKTKRIPAIGNTSIPSYHRQTLH